MKDELTGEQIVGVRVERGVAQLGDRPSFDLTYPFPGQIEMGTNLVKGPGFTPVEPEAKLKDGAFPIVENDEQLGDLAG